MGIYSGDEDADDEITSGLEGWRYSQSRPCLHVKRGEGVCYKVGPHEDHEFTEKPKEGK